MALTMSDAREAGARKFLAARDDDEGMSVERTLVGIGKDVFSELDATRAALAQAERELEQKVSWLKPYRDVSLALAAREAEVAELREALRTAMEMVRLWHGMGMDTVSERRAWKLYEEGAPEWQPLRDLRDRAPGSSDALRKETERCPSE